MGKVKHKKLRNRCERLELQLHALELEKRISDIKASKPVVPIGFHKG